MGKLKKFIITLLKIFSVLILLLIVIGIIANREEPAPIKVPLNEDNNVVQLSKAPTPAPVKIIKEVNNKTLKWFKNLPKAERKTFVKMTIENNEWDINALDGYYNCMGDFAYSKSETLKYSHVIEWCNSEYINKREEFESHFNELDAEDLSSASYVMCQQFMLQNLKSPASADFPWGSSAYRQGKNRYHMKTYVDSQNEYGAMIRTNWVCDIQYKGSGEIADINNWKLHSLEIEPY